MAVGYGRTQLSAPFSASGVSTGSSYTAYAAVGVPFKIDEACGQLGSFLGQANIMDWGTGSGPLRLHLYNQSGSGSPNGQPWVLASADVGSYLGYIEIETGDWVSGGGVNIAVIRDQPLFLHGLSGSRSVYGQFQATSGFSFGNITYPLRGVLGVTQD